LPKVQLSCIETENVDCWGIQGIQLFLLCSWGFEEVFPLGSAPCSKKIDDGSINMDDSKNKIKFMSTPMN